MVTGEPLRRRAPSRRFFAPSMVARPPLERGQARLSRL